MWVISRLSCFGIDKADEASRLVFQEIFAVVVVVPKNEGDGEAGGVRVEAGVMKLYHSLMSFLMYLIVILCFRIQSFYRTEWFKNNFYQSLPVYGSLNRGTYIQQQSQTIDLWSTKSLPRNTDSTIQASFPLYWWQGLLPVHWHLIYLYA